MKYVDYDIMFQEVPDEVTLALNISNCPNRCPGCHSSYLMGDIGKPLDENELDSIISNYAGCITCICFMGGDASPDELNGLARAVNCRYGGQYKVAWYSGRQRLPDEFDTSPFSYIKLGPYVKELGNLRCRTTNQRFYRVGDGGRLEDMTEIFWNR